MRADLAAGVFADGQTMAAALNPRHSSVH